MSVEASESIRPQPVRDQFAQIAGEIVGGAVLVSLVGAIPIALRMTEGGGTSPLRFWLALVAVSLPVSLAGVFFLRASALGLKAADPDEPSRRAHFGALALWIALTTVVLGLFAAVLSAGTHHRGLGATTFAIVGLGVAAGCAVVALRAARLLSGLLSRAWAPWVLLALSAVVPAGWLQVALRSATDAARPALLAVADVCVFVLLVVAASRLRLPRASLKYTVPGTLALAAVCLVAGVPSVATVARAGDEVRGEALLLAPVLDLISEPDAKANPRRSTPRPPGSAPAAVPSARAVPPPASSSPQNTRRAAGQRVSKPDIIVISLDSVRADHLSVYGYKRRTSPNLDSLAAKATVFERAYAAGPETRTAIVPVLTGRWLEQCVRDDRPWPTLLRANETLAERLRAQGYATGGVSSFQWLSEERGGAQGFELFDETPFRKTHPEKGITGASAIAQAIDVYTKLLEKDRPVFLWVHLFDAHQKYLEHKEFDFGGQPVDRYDAEIAYVDRELGRLIERVSAGKRAAKTVWVVHGTHGDAFGEHGFSGHPAKMYEEVIRVPLIVRFPWASPARLSQPAVSVIDIVPTALDLATAAGDVPGLSLANLVEGTTRELPGREGLLVSYAGIAKSAPVRAWIAGNLKLVVHGRGQDEIPKLFDLAADPGEQADLSSSRGADVERLRKAMDSFVRTKVPEVPLAPAQDP